MREIGKPEEVKTISTTGPLTCHYRFTPQTRLFDDRPLRSEIARHSGRQRMPVSIKSTKITM
jgi:hypothetical protein